MTLMQTLNRNLIRGAQWHCNARKRDMKYKAWAIVYDGGAFNGTYPTRLDAIVEHVCCLDRDCLEENPRMKPILGQTGLSYLQYLVWSRLKRRGHRCVRVLVSVLE
jgi:hypothetical protein